MPPISLRAAAQEWVLHLQRTAGNRAVTGLLDGTGQPRASGITQRPSGEALDAETRRRMEAGLGHDLGSVRVHSGPSAARAANRVEARAFTVGEDVVLGEAAPPVGTEQGQRLLAHELAHVVQQRRGGPPPGRGPEAASERDAAAAASGAPVSQGTAVGIARDERHERGYAGEQGMGFELYPQSEGWIFFEGPSGSVGHGTTEPGFDGVAYNTRTGELHLVDNKSLKKTGNVGSATAIDPSKNLANNVDDLIARVQAAKDVPGRIRTLGRLRALKASLASGQALPEGVHLVVTSVGGRTTDVTARLKGLGVEHRGETSPGTATKAPLPKKQPSAVKPAAQAETEPPKTLPAQTPAPVTKVEPPAKEAAHPTKPAAEVPAEKPKRTTFETQGEVTYETGGRTRPTETMSDPYGSGAPASIGEGLAAVLPEAMQALRDKTIRNAVAHRIKDQWSSVQQMRRDFPNDYIAVAVSLEEWEQPDPAGMVARMVNYVTVVHGATKDKCLSALSGTLRQGVPKGWVEVGPFIGFIGPADSLEKAYDEVTKQASFCFVATACYGSADAPAVVLLRRFRDRVLEPSAAGRAFVAWYYRWSPPLARRIAPRPRLRAAIRVMLLGPAVLIARAALRIVDD